MTPKQVLLSPGFDQGNVLIVKVWATWRISGIMLSCELIRWGAAEEAMHGNGQDPSWSR